MNEQKRRSKVPQQVVISRRRASEQSIRIDAPSHGTQLA
jgi:hypothetical protein